MRVCVCVCLVLDLDFICAYYLISFSRKYERMIFPFAMLEGIRRLIILREVKLTAINVPIIPVLSKQNCFILHSIVSSAVFQYITETYINVLRPYI